MRYKTTVAKFALRHLPRVLLIIFILSYILFFSYMTILRHRTLNSHGWDLGFYDQTLWNTAHGRWFACTLKPGITNKMADHFQPTLLPLAVFYLIHSSPETLLVVSTIILALGALPVYWIARTQLDNEYAALVFCGAYLLYPSLQAANMTDFHAVALAAPFLLFALYFLQPRDVKTEHAPPSPRKTALRYVGYFGCLILAMGTREDIALSVVAIGIYAVLILKKRAVGAATIALGAVWFILTIGVIVPHFNPEGVSPHSGYYDYLGTNLEEIVTTMISQPLYILSIITAVPKLRFVVQILAPLAFLPLFSLSSAFMGGAALLMNLLSSAENMYTGDSYYVTPLIPFLFFSAICGARNLANLTKRLFRKRADLSRLFIFTICLAVMFSTLWYHRYHGYTPLYAGFNPPRLTEHHRQLERFAARIPPDAPLAAQSDLVPHFSQREEIHVFPLSVDRVDYILLDVTSRPYPLSSRGDLKKAMHSVMEEHDFGIVAARDGYILLQHKVTASSQKDELSLSEEFYTFAYATDAEISNIEYPMQVAYGDALTLLGYNVVPGRNCEFSLDSYWRVRGNTGLNYDFDFWLHDAAGNVHWRIGAYLPHWYPSSQWRNGAVIRLSSPTFTSASLGKGFITLHIPEAENDANILSPKVCESALYLPALRHGTSLKIFDFACANGILKPKPAMRRYTTPQLANQLPVNFGEKIMLQGYELSTPTIHAGEELQFTLYWQAITAPLEFYNMFVHVIDENGTRVAQRDAPPLEGGYPTSWWARGEVVVDTRRVLIPPETSAGEYAVWIGVYSLETMARLSTKSDDSLVQDDAVKLLTFQVVD